MTNTTPAPGIDELLRWVEGFVSLSQSDRTIELAKEAHATLRAHKAIMEAERPEPVAYRWKWRDGSNGKWGYDETDHTSEHVFSEPLYGPDLLAYAERMRVERDALIALMREPDEEMYAAAVNHMRAVFAGGLSADINGTFKAMSAVALRKAGVA